MRTIVTEIDDYIDQQKQLESTLEAQEAAIEARCNLRDPTYAAAFRSAQRDIQQRLHDAKTTGQKIANTYVDVQNGFLLQHAGQPMPGAMDALIANIASLDAIKDLIVDVDDSITRENAAKIDIKVTYDCHRHNREDRHFASENQLMQQVLGNKAAQASFVSEKKVFEDSGIYTSRY